MGHYKNHARAITRAVLNVVERASTKTGGAEDLPNTVEHLAAFAAAENELGYKIEALIRAVVQEEIKKERASHL